MVCAAPLFDAPSTSLFITGLTSSCRSTRSPITIASSHFLECKIGTQGKSRSESRPVEGDPSGRYARGRRGRFARATVQPDRPSALSYGSPVFVGSEGCAGQSEYERRCSRALD